MLVPHPHMVVKNLEGYVGCRCISWEARGSQPHTRPTVKGSSSGKIKPHNFWLWKTSRTIAEWDRGLLKSQAVPLKGPAQRLTQTHTLSAPALGQQLQRYQGHMGRNYIVYLWDKICRVSFFSDRSAGITHCSMEQPSPFTPRPLPCLSLQQPGKHHSAYPGNSLRTHSTQRVCSPKLLPMAFPYK